MIIDTHHHFWHYNNKDFDWINDDMKVIKRDFLPAHLFSEMLKAGIDGVISIQACQRIEETNWLLKLARENDFINGVVGWLPLVDEKIENLLDKYCIDKNLKGLRHIIQDETDDKFILHKDFNNGIKILTKYGLVYDILIFDRHLPYVIQFVSMHPNQVFILDHIAKPRIKDNVISPWKENIVELAKRENVYCKISGMVTEADYKNWTEMQLQPYFDIVLEAFGPERLLFGSDWPVCIVATDYTSWVEIVKRYINKLSLSEQQNIMSKNAIKAYKLKI